MLNFFVVIIIIGCGSCTNYVEARRNLMRTGLIGPKWTRGLIEPPAGEKDMGGWIAAVYTKEQQIRLRVNERGESFDDEMSLAYNDYEDDDDGDDVGRNENRRNLMRTGLIGPKWTRGLIEPPAGEKDMGGWIAAVYTKEQQIRLRVNERGEDVLLDIDDLQRYERGRWDD
jgi:hypothetical protein